MKKPFDTDQFLVFILKFLGVFLAIFLGFSLIHFLVWDYPMDREVKSKLKRAQTMAEVEAMLPLIKEPTKYLKTKGQDTGHCALIFKTSENDLAAQYQALENVEKRLERTVLLDKKSPEYQQAVDDIRGILREIDFFDCWLWHFD